MLVLFLVVSPVRGLLFPGEAGGAVGGPGALDDADRARRARRAAADHARATRAGGSTRELFPNFARLARESTWYRNATTVDDLTTEAVPAQLTGERPRDGQLPTTRDHPRSLFTLFERSHALTVVEPITDLCPERLCGESRPGTADRLRSLESDLEVVVQHLLLPDDLREGLPAIDRVWEGFETGSTVGRRRARAAGRTCGATCSRGSRATTRRPGSSARSRRSTQRGSRPPLLFVHSTLPHGPWRYLPDGRRYPIEGNEYPGLAPRGLDRARSGRSTRRSQRHVLQVQYVDRLLGSLLDALRDARPVRRRRDRRHRRPRRRRSSPASRAGRSSHANIGAIAPVPFFVKLPGQRDGPRRRPRGADDRRAADDRRGGRRALPWKTRRDAGRRAGGRPGRADRRLPRGRAGAHGAARLGARPSAARATQVEARLLRDGVYAIGPRPDLIGRRVATRPNHDPVTVDADAAAVPAFVSGEADGLEPGAELAVAVDGRVEATTRVYRNGGRSVYAALVPPSSLRPGPNEISVLAVGADGELTPLG